MESGGGRSAGERQAAAEARARARSGDTQTGDENLLEGGTKPARAPAGISRHYGGGDVYARRRLLAFGAGAIILLILFLLLVGC